MDITIVDYGAGNTQSVIFALNRLGINPILSSEPSELLAADKVILPGVGHALAAMNALKEKGLDILIPQIKQPVLGICLGQQLMCRFSEEGNVPCLGIFDADVKLFPATEKVPHMGWNQVKHGASGLYKGLEDSCSFYHVHSYYVPVNEFTTGVCDYILPFSTSMQKDNFYAVQFHPEKSGLIGEQLLSNFLAS